jgi:hypothetical protein
VEETGRAKGMTIVQVIGDILVATEVEALGAIHLEIWREETACRKGEVGREGPCNGEGADYVATAPSMGNGVEFIVVPMADTAVVANRTTEEGVENFDALGGRTPID